MKATIEQNGVELDWKSKQEGLESKINNYLNDDDESEITVEEYGDLSEDSIVEQAPTDLDAWLNSNSGKSVKELQEEIAYNDITIAENDKKLREKMAERILDQQKVIKEQQEEIIRLQKTREITNEK